MGNALELERIKEEYRRRGATIPPDYYAPWQPSVMFMASQRRRMALQLLREADVFPVATGECLEIGHGTLGWLGDLITWGVRETHIHGIELDAVRALRAREVLPVADLRIGDASALPWPEATFQLVIASTVFTSILDDRMRARVANEITRVLASGGALLWYDFKVNNPRNPNVRGIGRKELSALFPQLRGRVKSVTLAPPLVRVIVPWSWTLATICESIPLLRTHLIGVLKKS